MSEDPQSIASTLALVLWPLASFCIFVVSKSFERGLIWNVLSGQLILPVGATIKFQMVPPISKTTVVNFCCFAAYFFLARRKTRSTTFGLVELLLVLMVLTPIVTSQLNSDDIIFGWRYLPGVGLYDALSAVQAALITLIPFLLARKYLNTATAGRQVLQTLSIAGLVYSIPMLFEVRFSPQLHFWIYGYYPSEFVQAMRNGSFRPMVFMGHGLLAAFFMMTCLIAATALGRMRANTSVIPPQVSTPFLGVVLVLCKTLGALIYGLIGILLVLFTKPKTQLRLAAALVTIALAYPMLRSFDLVPTSAVIDLTKLVSDERAQSLSFRLNNEDALLARAFERPVFGWGRYGRNRVYDEDSGKDLSVTDGRWIIDIGQFGLIGFIAEFGLLAICVYRAVSARTRITSKADEICFAALALIVSLNIFDLLPNSSLIPWTWLLAGSLLGQAEELLRHKRKEEMGRASPTTNVTNVRSGEYRVGNNSLISRQD